MRDSTPWRERRKAAIVTIGQRLAEVERKCRHGDLSLHEALIQAYTLGIEEGRANPAVVKVGEAHTPEVQS